MWFDIKKLFLPKSIIGTQSLPISANVTGYFPHKSYLSQAEKYPLAVKIEKIGYKDINKSSK